MVTRPSIRTRTPYQLPGLDRAAPPPYGSGHVTGNFPKQWSKETPVKLLRPALLLCLVLAVVPAVPAHAAPPTRGVALGTAVDADALRTDAAYRSTILREFSTVTAENAMKWESVEPTRGTYTWGDADELVALAQRHRLRVRGHTLVWHSQLPPWLTTGTFGKAELRQILKQHITTQVRHFRGQIWQWDVVNEAFDEDGTLRDTIWLRALGPDYIADAFRWAHAADPKAQLFYNDYNLEAIGPKSDAAYALVKKLRKEGVPIHGVGLQGHQTIDWAPPTLRENLARFSALGVKTAITEADVRMPLPADATKLQAQAAGFTHLLRACLLTRGCESFTVWGFSDKYSWVPGWFSGQGAATPMDEQFRPKPAWTAMRQELELAGGRR
jgi:endo-1,4-beta-xylanase